MIHRLRRGPQALRDDQARKLRAVVARAAARVPFYRRWLAGVDLSRLRGPEDLGLLPLLAKRDLRPAPLADRLADGVRLRHLVRITTSGSTGEPFDICRTIGEDLRLARFPLRAWRSLGARPTDRWASLSVTFQPQTGLPFRIARALRAFHHRSVSCKLPAAFVTGIAVLIAGRVVFQWRKTLLDLALLAGGLPLLALERWLRGRSRGAAARREE